ncbi:MAG TPA: hypothetical protein VGN16_07090 [Acidobacteriaceae bacterium]|jgi:hypothetical protein
MNVRTKLAAAVTFAVLAASALPATAAFPFGKKKPKDDILRKPTAAQNALIDKSIAREAVVIKTLKERTPLVETYIQNMKPDPVMFQTPESDTHMLARVDFGKVIGEKNYAEGKGHDESKKGVMGHFKHSLGYITGLSRSLHLNYNEAGFIRMIVIDTQGPNSDGYNRQNYKFSFVRNDFLGTIPTVVFDVQPVRQQEGRFFGRIWIERNNGNIVRYNGDLAGEDLDIKQYYHFDSWRTNLQEGLWLPSSSYIEETDPKSPSHTLRFKAVNNIWGYSLRIPKEDAEQASLDVVGAVDQSQTAPDVSPLQAQREWVQQAEDNVLERLFTAGLIDAPSDFDKTLADLANNILAYNQIATSRPLRVRTLLTEPLESVAIGNTILISKSLIDTTAIPSADGAQQMGNLNALLAFQVAHIILGHRIDTKFAFSDRLLFPPESAFTRLPMGHTDKENEDAAKKAIELLNAKELADGQQYFGLYLQQLKVRQPGLKALNTPQMGDSLLKTDGTPWLQAIASKAPKLNDKDLKQQGAEPLAQFLNVDPWTDQVVQKHVSYEPLLGAGDKMPFEIAPVYLKLAYWAPPVAPAPPAAAPATGAATPADGTAAPATGTAAPATGTATPPADNTTSPPANTTPQPGAPAGPTQ